MVSDVFNRSVGNLKPVILFYVAREIMEGKKQGKRGRRKEEREERRKEVRKCVQSE